MTYTSKASAIFVLEHQAADPHPERFNAIAYQDAA